MKKAIELVRVSTAGQAAEDKASIPSQRATNRETATRHNLEIIDTIELTDVSGASVLLAPEIQRMIATMAEPQIHGIVCREFSRLMRPENFADFALLQAFVDTGTILYLPEGPIDFASPDGRLLGGLRALIGGNERIELIKKMWRIKEQKRREGGFSQGPRVLPFGVTFEGGKWSYTPDSERMREAYRLLLAGELNYGVIARAVGMEVFNLRQRLKNPIYTGWRVIDKKRDMSPGSKRTKANGRQGDRRKIARTPEDVIRLQVIDEGLISESEFQRVQELMQSKKQGHWRLKDIPRRFTYNGFITCKCESPVYTKYRRDDYYVCKARCGAKYMRRDRLEPRLDKLFTTELTSIEFLESVYASARKNVPQVNVERLKTQLKALTAKRQRILDAYFEGVINGTERDLRLASIEREKQTVTRLLERDASNIKIKPATLAEMFSPFVEFDLLNRDQKRRILTGMTPTIIAKDYLITGVSFIPMGTRKGTDSLRPLT